MKHLLCLFVFTCISAFAAEQVGMYQQGSVVRMRMGECLPSHGFMASFGSPAIPNIPDPCPEYTLVSRDVVYLIVGRSSNQLIPLTETIDFRMLKNEMAVRVDDAKHETKFSIKEMMVRSEWDRLQRHVEEQMRAVEDRAIMQPRN